MALKFGRDGNYLGKHFDRMVHRSLEYVDFQLGKNFLEVTFVYLISINQIPDKKWEDMIDKLPKPVKSKAMTMYERLLKKGEEIGMVKGEEIGMVKGEEIGMVKGEEIGTNLTIQILKMHKSQIKPEIIAKKLNVPLEYVQRVISEFDSIDS